MPSTVKNKYNLDKTCSYLWSVIITIDLDYAEPFFVAIKSSMRFGLTNPKARSTNSLKNKEYHIPKPPQDTDFSVSQVFNIKALLCNNGHPF
ncbi:hypothetical protein ADS77_09650 [Pseudoalteromonas porphyrae]|uniref:Uncharacterized protein n=1 Tax=Pseudoalteromonas porphyrae TaxID=187330 RepID=A0A0N0M0A0_9GAMM|nr:hypothetical protein ADS77_09650 [Pseudoalteromonas porphyrae]